MKFWVWLAALGLTWAGCETSSPLPWRLLEVGSTPAIHALHDDQWLIAEIDGQSFSMHANPTLESQVLLRDLLGLPEIACGDVMVLNGPAFPPSIRHAMGWSDLAHIRKDSLLVRWTCLDQAGVERHFRSRMDASGPNLHNEIEDQWVQWLKMASPAEEDLPVVRYQTGEKVELTIVSTPALEHQAISDTVTLAFRFGDPDQVVNALMPGLSRSGPGSRWSLWTASRDAFGSESNPGLGLLHHTPIHFQVEAH